jgi:hypothetical protein
VCPWLIVLTVTLVAKISGNLRIVARLCYDHLHSDRVLFVDRFKQKLLVD